MPAGRFAAVAFLLLLTVAPLCAQVKLTEEIASSARQAVHKQQQADSSIRKYSRRLQSGIDSLQQIVSARIDSLQNIGEPADEYLRLADSLTLLANSSLNRVQERPEEWKQTVETKYAALEEKITGRISVAEQRFNSVLPSGTDLPGIPALSGRLDGMLSQPLEALRARMPEIPGIDLPGIDNPLGSLKLRSLQIPEIEALTSGLPDLSSIAEKVGHYGSELSALSQGDLSQLEELPDLIENKVTDLGPAQDFAGEAGDVVEQWKQYERLAGLGRDTAALKDFVVEHVRSYAVDHFADQQQMLTAALNKVSKLKSEYSEVTSLADLPKRPPNPMKSKEWSERLVPTLTLQVQKSDYLFIDFNPAVGWRFNGFLSAGAGWNERVGINGDLQYSVSGRVYGPRVYTEVRLPRGFSVRADGEVMNSMVTSASGAESGRDWVYSAFGGIKKDYRLFRNVRGNVQLLYTLYDDHGRSPYPDRLVMRVGMEFGIKGKRSAKTIN
jgi:hypothetical protein